MVTNGGRDFPQYRLNTSDLSVDLLNCSLTPLRYIVVGNHLERITNVVVQLRNPPQLIQHGLVASLNVSQNLEDQQADGQGHCRPSQHQGYSGKILTCYEPVEHAAAQEYEGSDHEADQCPLYSGYDRKPWLLEGNLESRSPGVG